MNVLTSLKELEGKTIKYIDGYNSAGSYNILIVTEDKAVVDVSFNEWTEYGDTSVICNLSEEKLDVYSAYGEELYRLGVITENEAEGFDELINEQENERLTIEEERNKKFRFEQYLELKKEFEVTYKL